MEKAPTPQDCQCGDRKDAGRVFPVASPWAHMRDAIPSFVSSQGKRGEIKDIKDLNDIKDAPKKLSLKSPLGSSVPLCPFTHGSLAKHPTCFAGAM